MNSTADRCYLSRTRWQNHSRLVNTDRIGARNLDATTTWLAPVRNQRVDDVGLDSLSERTRLVRHTRHGNTVRVIHPSLSKPHINSLAAETLTRLTGRRFPRGKSQVFGLFQNAPPRD